MKEALIAAGPSVTITDTPIPAPEPDQVLIQVIVSGTNPKDWKVPQWANVTLNQGDDIAGIVKSVGANVTEFKPGDRVAAFHQMLQPGGSYAEYAISWQHTTFHIPKDVSFEEAATIPLAAMTSAVAMYQHLRLPVPWQPATTRQPLVIYGGASAIGAYAIQLARRSNIHPIITVAGRGIPFVEGLIDRSQGDAVIDYRQGDDAVVSGIRAALAAAGHSELKAAYDAVSEKGSYVNLSRVMAPGGKIALILPGKKYPEIPESLEKMVVSVGAVHGTPQDQDFGYVFFRLIAKGLREGWFKPHPHVVVPGGLGGLQQALTNLKEGKASAVKYVVRIAETEGVLAKI
ncbi:chaperonin 10-like protein [Aspergillus ambiguus]|uniref:zinc-binding alcohol dehydrogenase family protein n=1 Tax=Aspergillus ambiguus TaxID=176160 RepID=UPI003CCDAB87